MRFSVADAKNKLPELIKAVENGETVTIYRRRVPAVDISGRRSRVAKNGSGTLKGKNHIHDIEWWKPMSDDEANAFVEGRTRVRLLLDMDALIFAVESPERITKRATGILQDTEDIWS